jgi:hypothetical protein
MAAGSGAAEQCHRVAVPWRSGEPCHLPAFRIRFSVLAGVRQPSEERRIGGAFSESRRRHSAVFGSDKTRNHENHYRRFYMGVGHHRFRDLFGSRADERRGPSCRARSCNTRYRPWAQTRLGSRKPLIQRESRLLNHALGCRPCLVRMAVSARARRFTSADNVARRNKNSVRRFCSLFF